MSSVRRFLYGTAACVLLALLVVYCYSNPGVADAFRLFSPKTAAIVFLLYIPFYVLNALILGLVVSPYAKNPNLWTLFGITQLSSLLNYLSPFRAAQLGARIVLLKRYMHVDFGHSVGTFVATSLITAIVGLALLAPLSWFLVPPEVHANSAWFLLAGVVIGAICLWAASLPPLEWFLSNCRVPKLLKHLHEGMSTIRRRRSTSLITLLITLQFVVSSVIMHLLLHGVQEKVTFAQSVAMTAFGNIAMIVSITPGNIGIKEFTFVGIGSVFGVSSEPLVAALLVDRVIQVVFLLLGSLAFLVAPSRRASSQSGPSREAT